MGRYLGPRNKLARRESVDLGLVSIGSSAHTSMMRRLNIPPGQHGSKGRRRLSGYGIQLREKQRLKRMYGIRENQFRRYFNEAIKQKGETGTFLLQKLETRLDNVVYRLGFTPTRQAARQLVSHGHVLVNNNKLDIPSYQVQRNDTIRLKEKSYDIPMVKQILSQKNPIIPKWLLRKGPVGKVLRIPSREDMDISINEKLIVEFYSR